MAHIEQTRAVVEADETFDGKIVPTVQAELSRPVRIRDGARVQGSIYGETVELSPESDVDGSIMASESVEIDGGHVHGEVGTPGKVVASDARIDGTVTGKRVTLENCVVRGNVVGTEVILDGCVVLGLATADRSLTLEDSLCYTFRGQGETQVADATVVLPQAIADGALTLETPVRVAGLGRLDVSTTATDSGADDETDSLPVMTTDDRYERDETTYLTLAPRLLNVEKVTDRLTELEQRIMDVVDDTSGDTGTDLSVEDVLALLDVDVSTPTAT